MSNTNELRKQINSILKTKCQNVYYEQASSTVYPYAVFELSEILQDCGKVKYKLEINCISKNVSEVESLADSIQDTLDHYHYINNLIAFDTYKSSRNTIYDEDKSIKRRRLVFELNFYSREENK